MNNIDILEEKEKRLGAYLAVLNEENILYKKEDAIEGIIKLFKTLIAENKELKEKNKELKVINKMQEYRISVIDERELISKSKIEEKIEELSGKVEVGDITREMFNRIEYAIEVLVELLDERSNTDEH